MDIEEILKITQESMDDALNCAGAKLDALRAENQRYREVLEKAYSLLIPIQDGKWYRRIDKVRDGLFEALKG